jgi:hypothetical protein
MISRAAPGPADVLWEPGALAHGLTVRMVTATATAIQKTSANLVLAAIFRLLMSHDIFLRMYGP